jgi:AraC-like DNA-binding protein
VLTGRRAGASTVHAWVKVERTRSPMSRRRPYGQTVTATPSAELGYDVQRYIGYRDAAALLDRREVPSPNVTLIISFGPELRIRDLATGAEVIRSSFVAGLQQRPVVTSAREEYGLQINLTPIGAYRVLGTPLSELTDRAVELTSLVGADAERLAAPLADARTCTDRFSLLDGEFFERLASGPRPAATTEWTWRRMQESGGRLPIGTLVSELGCTRKHLSERFHAEIGVPPKTLARLIRFSRAAPLLRDGRSSVGSVASACGYYDQAHLNREFTECARLSPTAFTSAFASTSTLDPE